MNKLSFTKRSGTHADVLAAVGAADLLSALEPILIDKESVIEVRLSKDLATSHLQNVGPGFKYLKSKAPVEDDEESSAKKAAGKIPDTIPTQSIFDYSAEDERYKRQMAARKSKDQDVAQALLENSADPEFKVYRIAKALQAESGLNKFVEQFFSLPPADRESAIFNSLVSGTQFFFKAPLVQLFNPQAAKGYALLKPTGTDRNDKTKDNWAEPLSEWLRYRGFFAGCAGWFLGAKGEHIRVYCPIPGEIPARVFKQVVEEFRAEALAGSAAKIDCRGMLRLTRILIKRSESFARPSRFISGVWATHFQSLGQVQGSWQAQR
jgi:hypothetical protein